MAVEFEDPIDLNKLEIQNVRLQQLDTDPVDAVEGQIWHRNDLHRPRVNDGTVNQELAFVVDVANKVDKNTPIVGATFTKITYDAKGLVTGGTNATKTDVGLGNVDNTSDVNKPVSTAQQTALNLKANLASPTFTGTVGGITKAMVGLGNVDNTSDANKPVSTATQTALNGKQNLDANLTSIAALSDSGTGLVRFTAGTASLDTNIYLTASQFSTNTTIALVGEVKNYRIARIILPDTTFHHITMPVAVQAGFVGDDDAVLTLEWSRIGSGDGRVAIISNTASDALMADSFVRSFESSANVIDIFVEAQGWKALGAWTYLWGQATRSTATSILYTGGSWVNGYAPSGDAASNILYQPKHPILTSLSSVGGVTGFLKTSAGVISVDNTAYITGNQTITLGGDASGSGTTAITVTNNKIVVQEHSANNADYPVVWENTSKQLFKTASKFLFNPSTGTFSSTLIKEGGTLLSAKYLGINANAASATVLQTARNINGVSFNGSADITITATPTNNDFYVQGQNGTRTTKVTDFNTILKSGFYNGQSATGSPMVGWHHLISSKYSDDSKDWAFQIAAGFGSGAGDTEGYSMRIKQGATWLSWRRLFHNGESIVAPQTATFTQRGNLSSTPTLKLSCQDPRFLMQTPGAGLVIVGNPDGSSFSIDATDNNGVYTGKFFSLVMSGLGTNIPSIVDAGVTVSAPTLSSPILTSYTTEVNCPKIFRADAVAFNTGNVTLVGENPGPGTVDALAISGTLRPSADNTYSLGDSDRRFTVTYAYSFRSRWGEWTDWVGNTSGNEYTSFYGSAVTNAAGNASLLLKKDGTSNYIMAGNAGVNAQIVIGTWSAQSTVAPAIEIKRTSGNTQIGFFGNGAVTRTQWTTATGTASRATFNADAPTLQELGRRLKAVIDDLKSLGLFQ